MELVTLLSLATGCVAFTVAETALFAPVRAFLGERSAWLGKLASCGFCLGFWIALALVALYRARLFDFWAPLDVLLTAFVVCWLSAFQWIALCLLLDRAGK